MDKTTALDTLDALAQETRLDVFQILIQAGPSGLPAGEIAENLGVRQNTMSSHLGILSRAGLIQSRREGRVIRYNANYEAMRGLIDYLMHDCCRGDPRLTQAIADPKQTRSRTR